MVFFRYLFCTIVCVGTAQTALAMNIISDPTTGTGKAPYADEWRGGATMYPKDSTYRTPKEIVNVVCTSPNLRSIEKYIKDGKLAVNDPLICCVGDRDPRSFYYPVEWIIYRWDKPEDAKMLEFLLKNGVPVDGYQDFNLLRGVLESLADLVFASGDSSYAREKKKSRSNFLLKCLTILLDFGVDIHKPFPQHNGFGFDNSPFVGHTAKDFLDQTKNPWSNADLWKQVKEKFDTYEQSHVVQPKGVMLGTAPKPLAIESHSDIFQYTGTKRYSDGWRGPINIEGKEFYTTPKDTVNWLPRGDSANWIIAEIKENRIHPNEPTITDAASPRSPRSFYYPLEYLIKYSDLCDLRSDVKTNFETLLEQGANVDGYQDYSPLLDILYRLSSCEEVSSSNSALRRKKRWLEYLNILLRFNVDLQKPFPNHNGIIPDNPNDKQQYEYVLSCAGLTAQQFLNASKDRWRDVGMYNKIKTRIDPAEASRAPILIVESKSTRVVKAVDTLIGSVDRIVGSKTIKIRSKPIVTQHLPTQRCSQVIPQPTGQSAAKLDQKFSILSVRSVAGLAALLAAGYAAYRYLWPQVGDDEDTQESEHEQVADLTGARSVIA